jgi:hypothetical protein
MRRAPPGALQPHDRHNGAVINEVAKTALLVLDAQSVIVEPAPE